MLSADVSYPDDVASLAEALQVDHVIVQEARGSGDAAGAMERISRLVDRLPFAAYVAVVDAPPDVDAGVESSRFLATALSRRIGKPGLYVVSASGNPIGIRIVGTGWEQTLFSLQTYTDATAVERGSGSAVLTPTVDVETVLQTALAAPPQSGGTDYETVSLPDDVVDELVERERDLQPYDRPGFDDEERAEPWSTGKRWMVGTAVGAGALAVLVQSVWGWPGWRRRRVVASKPAKTRAAAAPPDLETVRAEADAELTALAEALPTMPPGTSFEQAALAREAAEPLLRSGDVLDVVGAWVLARAGRREVAVAAGRARKPYGVCFFDPRHAQATQTAEWRYGDAEVEVPVCSTCRRAVAAGRSPEALVVPHRGGLRPYYEGDTVWAHTGFGSLAGDLGDLARQVAADRGRSR
jgi:hypothetical protein